MDSDISKPNINKNGDDKNIYNIYINIILIIIYISLIIFIFKKTIAYFFIEKHNNKIEVLYFYTDWCYFCKKFTPEWNKFKNKCDACNYIKYIEIDENEYEKNFKKYNINEYPTILIKYNNKLLEYNEERNAEKIYKYIIDNNI